MALLNLWYLKRRVGLAWGKDWTFKTAGAAAAVGLSLHLLWKAFAFCPPLSPLLMTLGGSLSLYLLFLTATGILSPRCLGFLGPGFKKG